jgi:hypothetical protein
VKFKKYREFWMPEQSSRDPFVIQQTTIKFSQKNKKINAVFLGVTALNFSYKIF